MSSKINNNKLQNSNVSGNMMNPSLLLMNPNKNISDNSNKEDDTYDR
jgi:hypothetical protein